MFKSQSRFLFFSVLFLILPCFPIFGTLEKLDPYTEGIAEFNRTLNSSTMEAIAKFICSLMDGKVVSATSNDETIQFWFKYLKKGLERNKHVFFRPTLKELSLKEAFSAAQFATDFIKKAGYQLNREETASLKVYPTGYPKAYELEFAQEYEPINYVFQYF